MVFLTAGAAGMFCGSCLHDNALAKSLIAQGVDCTLQPLYTPIRTDSESVARERVFLGGIHIYLLQRFPWLSKVPALMRRPLDMPSLIAMATRRTHATDPKVLGELTVSMLQGRDGNQAGEVERLVRWLADEMKPDAIVLSNLLIGGVLPAIRTALPRTSVSVLLQGDDIFLDYLREPSRSEVIRLCRSLVGGVDHFITNSQFYSDKMGSILQIPDSKLHVFPLSIDTAPYFQSSPKEEGLKEGDSGEALSDGSFRLGFLARIAPEKGLHHLVDAFLAMAKHDQHADLTLHIAGWLGQQHQGYFDQQVRKIHLANLGDRFTYHDLPAVEDKVTFLRSLDLFSVPTDYHDPKGLFVLEVMAAGVAVIQPDHGAFGELIAATGGGITYPPGDVDSLVAAITDLKLDGDRRRGLAETGRNRVRANHDIHRTAQCFRDLML